MKARDYNAILGIPPSATPEQIERAYKRLVTISHPDVYSGDPSAEAWANERMKQIHEAYDTLKDPAKRADYERSHRAWRDEQQRAGGAPRQQAQEQRVRCPLCGGPGEVDCLTCQGRGDWSCPGCGGSQQVVCPVCGGAGSLTQAEYERRREEVERAEARARQRGEEEARRQQAERQRAEGDRRQHSQREARRRAVRYGVAALAFLFVARSCVTLTGQSPRPAYMSKPTAVGLPNVASSPSGDSSQGANLAQRPRSSPQVLRSIHGRVPTTLTFVNRTTSSVRILWLNYQGREVFYRSLGPGESYTQTTYATHPWRIRDASSGKVLRTLVANADPERITIGRDQSREESDQIPTIPLPVSDEIPIIPTPHP